MVHKALDFMQVIQMIFLLNFSEGKWSVVNFNEIFLFFKIYFFFRVNKNRGSPFGGMGGFSSRGSSTSGFGGGQGKF